MTCPCPYGCLPTFSSVAHLTRSAFSIGSGMEMRLGRTAMQSASARGHTAVVAYLEHPPMKRI